MNIYNSELKKFETYVVKNKGDFEESTNIYHNAPDIESCDKKNQPIYKYKDGKLSVTDLSSQIWCESQLEYVLITGRKIETESMKSGSSRHLELELQSHDITEIEVTSVEEDLGIKLLNSIVLIDQLQYCGKIRELWIFGVIDGILIRGIIDQIEIQYCYDDDDEKIVISDTKTREKPTEPSPAQKCSSAIQLQMYRWLLEKLQFGNVDFSTLYKAYKCCSDKPFTIQPLLNYVNLNKLSEIFQEKFKSLPKLSNYLEVTYEHNSVIFSRCPVPYSAQTIMHQFQLLMQWWQGKRETEGVLLAEKWKCRYCQFVLECSKSPLSLEEKDLVLASKKVKAE